MIIIFIANTNLKAQKLDSLYAVLKEHPQADTTRVNLLLQICYYEYTSNPEKNKAFANEAIEISRKLNFTKGVGYAMRYVALYHWVKGDYEQAAQQAFEMLSVFEATTEARGLAQAYQLLGLIHEEWDNFEKAELYHTKALEINQKAGRKYDVGYNLNSLGSLYHGFSKYDQATEHYLKSLEIRKEINDEDGMSQSYNNLAQVHKIKKEYATSLGYFEKALAIAKKIRNKNRISIVLMGMGDVNVLMGNYDKAEPFLQEAFALAKELKSKKRMKETYRKLAVLEDKRKNYKAALEYLELEYKYQDSIFTEDKSKQIAEMETRYETAKKEQAIQILERDKKIEALWRNILIASLIVGAVSALVIYRLQQYRNKKNQELLNLRIDFLMEQHQELTEKFKYAMRKPEEQSFESHDQLLLKKILDIVEKNMADTSFGVEKMADEMGMSRANLHRKLKSIAGFSPSDFLRNVRLRRAATMLRDNVDTISQIAYKVGFEDQSYFSKSFKKHFGVSPSEYVKSEAEVIT
ncbi:MAG: tetratricopeptide repeat protein [Bacteroidota bacterium]